MSFLRDAKHCISGSRTASTLLPTIPFLYPVRHYCFAASAVYDLLELGVCDWPALSANRARKRGKVKMVHNSARLQIRDTNLESAFESEAAHYPPPYVHFISKCLRPDIIPL